MWRLQKREEMRRGNESRGIRDSVDERLAGLSELVHRPTKIVKEGQ
jgi:hypothetical protein